MDAKTAGKLIVTGLGFGCIHVLTGADHLSALATLAVGSRFKAFSLGIRWGLGHSTGLIVVAGVLLGLGDGVNAKKLEQYCNWIVGAFMIGLGVWGIYKALKHRRQREKEEQEQQGQEMATVEAALGDEEEGGHAQEEEEGRVRRLLQAPGAAAVGAATVAEAEGKAGAGGSNTSSSSDGTWSSPPGDDRGEEEQEEMLRLPRRSNSSSSTGQDGGKAQAAAAAAVGEGEGEEDGGRNNRGHQTPTREPLIFLDEECEEGEHLILRCCKRLHLVDIESPLVQRVVAFVIGIVHGIAGPGGILGVLPAIQLKSWQKASLYLGTFCFASTMIMGIFAALYGELSARVGSAKRMEFQMEVFSASLSIIVGILWISLIIAGKLDLVFP